MIMSRKQIEALRKKFFLLSSASYFLVMLFIGGIIYITNAAVLHSQIYSDLRAIADAEGNFDVLEDMAENGKPGETMLHVSETEDPDMGVSKADMYRENRSPAFHTPTFFDAFGQKGYLHRGSDFHKTLRYFVVLYDSRGNFEELRTHLIDFADTDIAIEAAQKVIDRSRKSLISEKHFGNYDEFYYLITSRVNGNTLVVFLDSSENINDSNRLFYTALILILIGSIAVLILMRILSYRVIQPEIRNARLQKQFITNASHELKTPLAVIRANTELEQMINGENEWNQSTLRQIDRMNGLIANLVMIARAEEKSSSGELLELNISALVRETADTFQSIAQQENKTFETDIPDNILLEAEESDMRQLFSLLIDNALKYCDENGTIRITLASISRGKQIRLEVSNTFREGATVNYTRFFDRFYRQDESHNTDKGGYGIGLSIAESLVRKYHGDIRVFWKNDIITFRIVL